MDVFYEKGNIRPLTVNNVIENFTHKNYFVNLLSQDLGTGTDVLDNATPKMHHQ